MSKNMIIFVISILLIVVGIVIIVIIFCKNAPLKNDVIVSKEMALEVGQSILKSKFNILESSIFEVEDKGDCWKVYSYVPPKENADGTMIITAGGGTHVIFSKNNAKIISIRIDD